MNGIVPTQCKIKYLLACFQLIIALIADSNIEFKAHDWDVDAIT